MRQPPAPRVESLPGWRDPLDLLEASRGRRRVALLWSGGDHPETARFSLLVADPYLLLAYRSGRASIEREGATESLEVEDPFALIGELLARHPSSLAPPWPFAGGAVGFIAYDAARCLERLPARALDDRPHAEIDLSFHGWAIAWDRAAATWAVLATGAPGDGDAERQALARAACEREGAWALRASKEDAGPLPRGGARMPEGASSFSRDAYLGAVRAIQRRIAAGDVYEVNLSRRLSVPAAPDPRALFAALCRMNAAPFASFIETSSGAIVSSSPERFLRVRGGMVESSPIKGTARRHADPAGDAAAARALLGSAKDRAENVMIVDLVRNDLGRVCRTGSVEVASLCALESFEGVHHLVSTVRGALAPRRGAIDAVRALFPPGSMTGAPKIRAMEVIDEIEPVRRGPYAGAAGYLASSGDADLSVLIRSFVLGAGRVDLQTGGAVVADSDPGSEHDEAVTKGERALAALAAVSEEGVARAE
ncbi:MAG: anthranilate synthase component I family protein [Acidobacteria bacterium]|nr:anthranilate synthase component I family protein [Acidobacteriota bacterium]